ncbi:hypothetical protein ACFOYW_15165 [Gryllotalpicola reticulitermitis]|uniref:Uncharacterized protein n=1 Tax=Gryllotalpicola reticulitermitis TaxID=1184153 RepID=A0ABV8QAM2_9MICO
MKSTASVPGTGREGSLARSRRRRVPLLTAALFAVVFALGAVIEPDHLSAGNLAGDEVTYATAGWQYLHDTSPRIWNIRSPGSI